MSCDNVENVNVWFQQKNETDNIKKAIAIVHVNVHSNTCIWKQQTVSKW